MDPFSFYAVDDGVQHWRGDQQVDIVHDDMNERGSTLDIPVSHGLDNWDQDCQDMGQVVVQSLEMLSGM